MEQVTAVFAAFLIAVGPLAIGVTKAVDLIRNVADKNDTWPKWSWNVAAFVLGAGVAVGWGYNLVAAVAHQIPALSTSSSLDGVAGQLLTGVAIGAVASYWHERMDIASSAAKIGKMPASP
jgi:hypothetical protein